MAHERLPVGVADLDDLDLVALERFLGEHFSGLVARLGRDEAAMRLGLLARAAPRIAPTLAGLYLFGRAPQVAFPEWGVVCLCSSGTSLLEPVAARADLDGAVLGLLEGALEFLRRQGAVGAGDAGDYPEAVVRELVVNALVHRDLRRPSRVALRLFADRLEVWSPGGAPEGLGDLEELAREGGVSQPRNPIIASLARLLGCGEQLGRGLCLVATRGAASPEHRVELRTSSRDVLAVVPTRWRRPLADRLA